MTVRGDRRGAGYPFARRGRDNAGREGAHGVHGCSGRRREAEWPRSRKGIRTRARLVEAAKKVFEESGFLDARISDIAERAGLSHQSFYHYFDSKEEIFREVAGALEEQLSAHSIVDGGLLDTSGASMRDRLTESNHRYLAGYRNEARIMGVIEQVSRYDEEVRAARLARQRHSTEQTEVAIRRLQRQGLADPTLDPTLDPTIAAPPCLPW